jgi:hypothetical protein
MRFFYNGISYGPSVNKNQIYSGKQLVELIVFTIKQLYNEGWDITKDDIDILSKIDLNNIQFNDIIQCQEICGADLVPASLVPASLVPAVVWTDWGQEGHDDDVLYTPSKL